MQVPVVLHRTKARRLATRIIAEPDPSHALDSLRNWALTRGVEIESALSFVAAPGGNFEVRCPVGEKLEVHPDDGISIKRVPSQYLAEVELPDSNIEPKNAAASLHKWIEEAGYKLAGEYEVFVGHAGESLRVAYPVRKKEIVPTIDL